MENGLGISLADYQGPLGNEGTGAFDFSNTTREDLAQLSKALESGSATGREVTNLASTGAQALKVESLEKNLKLITFKESDIVLWRKIKQNPAYNTVEEYNQLVSYGSERSGAILDGELPSEQDSVYERRAGLVKFYGVTKSINHSLTLVQTNIGPIMQQEIKNGSLWILRAVNRALTQGSSKNVPAEVDGLYSLHASNDIFTSLDQYFNDPVVIDMNGQPLSPSAVEAGQETIIENFGEGNLLMAPPRVISDFAKSFYNNLWVPAGVGGQAGANVNTVVGSRVKTVATQFGDIELGYDKFMVPSRQAATQGTQSFSATDAAKAPNAVTSTSVTVVSGDSSSKFTSSQSVWYAVSAKNRFGESALTVIGSSLTAITAGQSVDLLFGDGGGTFPATSYVIYRTKPTAATAATGLTFYPIFTVSVTEKNSGYDGAASNGKVRDRNRFQPGTYQAFLIENDEDVVAIKQLAPLMKMDLALLGPAYRFMVLLYFTLQLYAPKKMVRYINIGTATSSNLNAII